MRSGNFRILEAVMRLEPTKIVYGNLFRRYRILNIESFFIAEKHFPQSGTSNGTTGFKVKLNLVKDKQGIVICNGRIQGFNAIFLPRNSTFTKKMVMDAHLRTLHGGVGSTMIEVQ